MLAGWLEVEVGRTADGLGLVVDGSNNAVSSLTEGGSAMQAGMNVGDLIVSIDGQAITEFDGQPGPAGGTVLVTSEPMSIMAAKDAINPSASSHSMQLLRIIDPATLPGSPLNSPGRPQQPAAATYTQAASAAPQPQPAAYQQVDVAQEQQQAEFQRANAAYAAADLEEHYPWAGDIHVPDASFGASGSFGNFKAKYNLGAGSALPPVQSVAVTHETNLRKTMFSGRPSNIFQHQQ